MTIQEENEINKQAKLEVEKFIKSFGDNVSDYNTVFYNKKQSIGFNAIDLLKDLATDLLTKFKDNEK